MASGGGEESIVPTDEWMQLGPISVRRWTDYPEMRWGGVHFRGYLVAMSQFAGPIAVVQDPRQLAMLRHSGVIGDDLVLFTQSGIELGRVAMAEFLRGSLVVGLGWTRSERLAVVFGDGRCVVFSPKGEVLAELLLFPSAESGAARSVTHVSIRGATLAAVFREKGGGGGGGGGMEYHLAVVYDLDAGTPTPVQVRTGLGGGRAPTCVAVLDVPGGAGAGRTQERPEVLLGTQDASVVVVSGPDEVEDQELNGTVLTEVLLLLSPSPSGAYLAAVDEGGALLVLPRALDGVAMRFATHQPSAPDQVAWMGNDCVALAWQGRGVLLVCPTTDYQDLAVEGADLVLSSEPDGLRILTPESLQSVQRVPAALHATRSPGTSAPPARLLRAYKRYAEGRAGSEAVLRALEGAGELNRAVSLLLQAAPEERDAASQRQLLRAASFGLHASSSPESDRFVAACRATRLLNRLRGAAAGLPLTAEQYASLGARALAHRLAQRHQHRLALQLCEFLGLRSQRDDVLVHWARATVTQGRGKRPTDDAALLRRMRRRLRNVGGVSFADIAAAADAVGRRELATQLLLAERRAERTVLLWLKMRQGEIALHTALRHGTTDLVHAVLQQLHLEMVDGDDAGFAGDARALVRAAAGSAAQRASAKDSTEQGGGAKDAVMGTLAAALGSRAGGAHRHVFPDGTGERAFVCILSRYDRAMAVHESFLRSRAPFDAAAKRNLHRLWLLTGRVEDAAMALVEEAAELSTPASRKAALEDAAAMLAAAASGPQGDKKGSVAARSRFGVAPPGWPGGEKPLGQGPEAAALGLAGEGDEEEPAAKAAESAIDLPPATALSRPYAGSTGCKDNLAFLAGSLEAAATLVQRQTNIVRKLRLASRLGGATVQETLEECAVRGEQGVALATELLKDRELRIPAERWWYARVHAWAKAARFSELEALAASVRSSPIGWRPFVDACLDRDPPNPKAAAKFIQRLQDPAEKVSCFLRAGLFEDAANIAAAARDEALLHDVLLAVRKSGLRTPDATAARDIAKEALEG